MSKNDVHNEVKQKYNALQTYNSAKYNEEYYKAKAKNKLKDYGSYLPKDKNAKILDLACGQGVWCYALKSLGYTNYVGVDNSEDQVDLYKKFVSDKVVLQDIFAFLEENNEKYDIISFFDVIEHLEKIDAIKLIRLVHNKLNPGGKFFLKTPNMNSPNCNIYSDITHIWGYNEFSLKAILMTSDFSKIEIKGHKPRFMINYVSQAFIKFIILLMDLSFERKDRITIFTSNLAAIATK